MAFSDEDNNSSKCTKSIAPSGLTRTNFNSAKPNFAQASAVCITAWCSTGEVIMTLHPPCKTADCKTVLSASVPPEVKKISEGDAFKIVAIVLRAFSTATFA